MKDRLNAVIRIAQEHVPTKAQYPRFPVRSLVFKRIMSEAETFD